MATFFLLIIYITFIGLGLPDSLLGAAWPLMRLDFGMPLDSAGIITMTISGGTIISSLLSERVLRRFGTGLVTAVSVLATSLSLLFIYLGTSFAWLVVLAVPLGLGAGAIDAALNNYVALHYQARHMSWLHSFWGVGAFCSPLIMSGFLKSNNWRGGFLVVSLLLACITLLLFATLPLWKQQTPTAKIIELTPSAIPPKTSSAFKIPGVVPALAFFLLYCALEYAVGLWGSSFLVEIRGYTPATAASTVALYYGGVTVGRMLTGFLTFKLNGKQLIRIGQVLILIGVFLLVLPLPTTAPAALTIIGLGCAPIYPSMIHETPRRFGIQNSQKIVGLQMAFAYCGSTFVPPIIGVIAQKTSMNVLLLFLLGFIVAMFLCSEIVNKLTRVC